MEPIAKPRILSLAGIRGPVTRQISEEEIGDKTANPFREGAQGAFMPNPENERSFVATVSIAG
jgi:hypothetical protein